MRWIVAHIDHSVGFPVYLSQEDQVAVRRLKATDLLERISKKYPEMKVLKASVLGSIIELPDGIDMSEFEKEFNCKVCC